MLRFSSSLLTFVLPFLASGLPSYKTDTKPPAFFLAGDSTTAVGGGWGDGLLATLRSPAWGVNIGQSGATTVSFENGGNWTNVTTHVQDYAEEYDTYVTISVSPAKSSWEWNELSLMHEQFGHNDQKSTSGVTFEEYQANLVRFAEEVKSLGGTPVRCFHPASAVTIISHS